MDAVPLTRQVVELAPGEHELGVQHEHSVLESVPIPLRLMLKVMNPIVGVVFP